MKKLYNIITMLAILNLSNVIASEGQSDIETNPFLRKYKQPTTENNDFDDEEGGNNGFYYDNKALRDIHNKYDTKKDFDDKTIIENTNKLIANNRYTQLQKVNNSWLIINYYLNKLNLLGINHAELKDTPGIIQTIIRNYLSKDEIKDILDSIQTLYKSSETSYNDKSKLFEIFNKIKEIRHLTNTYITNTIMNDYKPQAIDYYKGEISNNINDIQDILNQLTKQIANELNYIPETLSNFLNNILPNINKLMEKYCKAMDLYDENADNENIANYFRQIVFNIDDIIKSVGYYFQKV